ncbi:MAG: choice-of-anchor D domain-containing protein, partial [Verrucomicrobiaceae bacterium]
MGKARAGHAASLLQDGRLLVTGGDSVTESTSEIYNPATATWSPFIPYTGSGAGDSGAIFQFRLASGKVVAVGKLKSQFPNSPHVHMLDPATETWSAGPSSPGFTVLNAVLLAGDRILINGYNGTFPGVTPTVQILEPMKGNMLIREGTTQLIADSLLDVGAAPLGVPRYKTLTLTNTGTTSLRLKTDDVEQPVVGEFTAVSGASTLAAGATTTVTVTFTPAAAGTRSATLYVWTKTGDDAPILIPIRLEGRVGTLTPYEEWAAAAGFVGANSGPDKIYRGDGVKNLLKFAFNTVTDRPDVSIMAEGGTGGLPPSAMMLTSGRSVTVLK